jgi:nitronate monooxygenase
VVLSELSHPIVLAPMAGGPGTVDLAVAVCEAGGLGFLAAGYRTPTAVGEEISELRERTDRPFGVNLFVPGEPASDEAAVRAYVERLGPSAGEPRFDDDGWDAKLEVLLDARVPVVSFSFGCPEAAVIAALRAAGSEVWVTVSAVDEARIARDAGADVVVVQGAEAGGHRASFVDRLDSEGIGLTALLRLVADAVDLPLVAAGGLGDRAAVAGALATGAAAVQIGTAFMRAPEAGTHPAHAGALATDTPTATTRAFTGRLARGLVNRFMLEYGPAAPIAYPEIHHATAPLRAAARERGDIDGFNLWAGQAHSLAEARPAAEIVRALS